jgi:hypothetical protein
LKRTAVFEHGPFLMRETCWDKLRQPFCRGPSCKSNKLDSI